MRLALLLVLALVACTPQTGPSPNPAPTPTPTVTIPPPPPADAGVPPHAPDCIGAYTRMFALGCPPAEDAHFGWRDLDCPKLDFLKVACIVNAQSCLQTRQCQE